MRITDSIHGIKIPFEIPGTGFWREVYIYVIEGDEITIIDSGVAGSERFVKDYLESLDRGLNEISKLIITHAHPDHIGSAKVLQEITGAKIGSHKDAIRWIENIELQNQERPVQGFFELVGGSSKVDFIIEDGSELDLGAVKLKVFSTPGHSNDSLTFFDKESRTLFTGDVIPQWNDLPIYDNYYELKESLEFLLTFDKIDCLLSSWSDPIKGDELAKKAIREGLEYIEAIHREIVKIEDEEILRDGIRLCSEVITNLGLSPGFINSMVAKSFSSHLISMK